MDFSKLKRDICPMPDDVWHRLNEEGLTQAYQQRPPYQQNDYIGWITQAKRVETRSKRLEQMIVELHDGHLYMGMAYRGNKH